ncbi:TetR/AcrR family transcriptional regulator [Sphingobacterium thalpophilum]|uniref:TetR/AcrR family transcriptional regulator n=1 Tax=Sphingobacterium thalpophilum TaxID=259 RepID=UPI0024A70576|nr:TetR/AcrR family transcriptional regulator [Sphingobacterium thalpophilum]
MNTKEKIISVALRLYNKHGIRTVTTRHIAQEMAISAGNLHYHFKHTEDIVLRIFEQLQSEYDQMVVRFGQNDAPFEELLDVFIEGSYRLIDKYTFIFVNFVEICAWIPAIAESYKRLVARREQQFMVLFEHYTDAGVFRSNIPASVWRGFVRQIFIVSDFWCSSFTVLGGRYEMDALSDYRQTIKVAFYPYLA